MAKEELPVSETGDEHNDVVILMLDRPRELRLGHKAMKRFSAMSGKKLTDMQAALDDYATLSTLIYVMLAAEDKTLTPEKVDDLIDAAEHRREDPLRLSGLMAAVAQAITAAFGDGKDGEADGETPPPAAGTGVTV